MLQQSRRFPAPTFLAAIAALATAHCGDEELNRIEEPPAEPLSCPDGSEPNAAGKCPQPPGTISGYVCDPQLGEWLEGVTVSVDVDGETISTETNASGEFELQDIPPGNYYVNFEGDAYSNEVATTVEPGEGATIGQPTCKAPPGALQGRICDQERGMWVSGATVTLDDEEGTSTTTDQFGNFIFLGLAPDTYVVTIESDTYSGTRTVEVSAGETTKIGSETCVGHQGSITGRICGGNGYWLANARVFVELPNGTVVETTTDADGYYELTGVPAGTHTVQVSKGSFFTSFETTVTADETTDIPEPVCVPPTTEMAVVTGTYDQVQVVLEDLGFAVHEEFNSAGVTEHDPEGNVDVIDGVSTDNALGSSAYWVNEFLLDPARLAQYDIIFFNCGLNDNALVMGSSGSQAIANLKDFVAQGGSIYASDWAYDVVRMAFPGRINFFGDDNQRGAARQGEANDALPTTAVDPGLITSLGRSDLVFNMNLPQWALMDRQSEQPSNLRVLVRAPSVNTLAEPATVQNPPVVVQFKYGQGRVLFTSAHNESQTTPDLEDVLNFIIFEL